MANNYDDLGTEISLLEIDQAVARYAKSLGKSALGLTVEERQYAIFCLTQEKLAGRLSADVEDADG